MSNLEGTQKPINGSVETAKLYIKENRSIAIPGSFSIQYVDPTSIPADDKDDEKKKAARDKIHSQNGIKPTSASEREPKDDGHVGALDEFVGNYIGNGLNTIFRPRNGFPGKISADDNLLEINVTKEQLSFLSREVLGAIPNRGFGGTSEPPQRDVILRGIPYTQQITDLIDQNSKTLREPGIGIHFEQGLFLRTPATDRPKLGATLSRLGSIPHGTTINAQGTDPGSVWVTGPPDFAKDIGTNFAKDPKRPDLATKLIPISPFFIDDPTKSPVGFINETKPEVGTRNRLPNKLDDFIDKTPVKHFQSPVKALIEMNLAKNIIKHRFFEVNTSTAKKDEGSTAKNDGGSTAKIDGGSTANIDGGGTANIAFLQGPGPKRESPNANAVKVTCRYWVSVVRVEVTLQPTNHGRVEVKANVPDQSKIPKGVAIFHPTFIVNLKKPLEKEATFPIEYTQIQYAQDVTLDFGPLSWPHVSVATLVPGGPNADGKVELDNNQLPKVLTE